MVPFDEPLIYFHHKVLKIKFKKLCKCLEIINIHQVIHKIDELLEFYLHLIVSEID